MPVTSLVRLRYERGMNQSELARKSGISRFTIMELEADRVKKPTAEVAKALADALEVPVSELMGWDGAVQ